VRGGEDERMTRVGATGSKVEQYRGIIATVVIASSLSKEARGSTVSTSRDCIYGRSRKNKCDDGIPEPAGRVCIMQPICHRYRQGE